MSKPIVIFPSKGDEITLRKDEFETYLQQAYDAGFEDGKNSSGTPVITHPYTPYNPPSVYYRANTFDHTVSATGDRE